MNVHLTEELEAFVQKKVESGLYRSASEVVREALRLLARRDAEDKLEALLLEGLESGAAREMTPEDWQEVRASVRDRLTRRG